MILIRGGVYALSAEQIARGLADTPIRPFEKNTVLLSQCREAFSLLGRLAPVREKRVLLPAYTCQTVIQPFVELGYTCAYFPVDEALRIEPEAFRALIRDFRPELVVVHPYYGMDLNAEELSLLEEAKKAGAFIAQDLTQSVFSRADPQVVDCTVASLRKWYQMPDGAFLRSEKLPLPAEGELTENEFFVSRQRDAMYLFGLYQQTGDKEIMAIVRHLLVDSGGEGSVNILPHRMSDFSRRLMQTENAEENNRLRMENAACLFTSLQDSTVCRQVYRSLSDIASGPLWYPMYLTDKRAVQKRVLAPAKISTAGLWPIETEGIAVNDTVEKIYRDILAFPCDQVYGKEEMQRIVTALKQAEKENF